MHPEHFAADLLLRSHRLTSHNQRSLLRGVLAFRCCMFVPCSSDPPETSTAVYRQSPPRSFTCGQCDCQPLICRRRHASLSTSARALPQCSARHLLREMLASYPTTVVLRRFPQHPSVGGIFSTVGQHRRRVVPGEELTYLSAAPRTSSPRDTLRRV